MTDQTLSQELMLECNFTVNGRCDTVACYRRSGWACGIPAEFEPVCLHKEAATALDTQAARIAELERQNAALEGAIANSGNLARDLNGKLIFAEAKLARLAGAGDGE